MRNGVRYLAVGLVALSGLCLVVGAGAGTTARGPELTLRWQAPTPRDGKAFAVKVGEPLTLDLAVTGSTPQLVVVNSRRLPTGVHVDTLVAHRGVATVAWTPTGSQVGEHMLTFSAETRGFPHAYAPPRSFLVYVLPLGPGAPNKPFPLGGANGMSKWADLYAPVFARVAPSSSATRIIRLNEFTPEGTQNLVETLSAVVNEKGQTWVRVRLPVLPNGTTGWVPRAALGPYNTIWTHLVIDRTLFTATLYRKGVAVFTTRVGVGKPYWPTPAGEFYVRERITGFSDLIYGPLAFGTNARSNVLTDWPGGGFIGIHGTSQPQILPGRVSHGCVRMPNAAILRLSRLMPLGTPVTIL